jgi:hypothetical protein
MQIASQHAEAVGKGSGIRVEKRLLLDRITLHSSHVAPGNVKRPTAVIANFADARLAIGDGTAVSTGITAHAIFL